MDSVIHLYKGLIQRKLVQGLQYNVKDEDHFSISQTCQVTTFTYMQIWTQKRTCTTAHDNGY